MKKPIKCLIIVLLGIVAALLLSFTRGILNETDPTSVYHNLCDSFTVVGTIGTGLGLLLFVSNHGAFDGISYGFKSFFGMFRKNRVKESYYDYRTRRGETKLKFTTLLISGLILLVVAVVFYLLYRSSL